MSASSANFFFFFLGFCCGFFLSSFFFFFICLFLFFFFKISGFIYFYSIYLETVYCSTEAILITDADDEQVAHQEEEEDRLLG